MRIAVVYNKPELSYYSSAGEQEAVDGVLVEAAAVQNALKELGHKVVCLALALPIEEAKQKLQTLKVDLVFNLFEGFSGFPDSEPDIPEYLSQLDLRFTGCPPEALRLALNKSEAKRVLSKGGILTPSSQLIGTSNLTSFHLNYPCIVKPNSEDASHGLTADSVVHDFSALSKQLRRMVNTYGMKEVLVEEYIDGREFNATATGNHSGQVLAISEIKYSLPPDMPRIITYAGKWDEDSEDFRGTKPVCPADISESERLDINDIVEKSYLLTGCGGYARVDMRMNRLGKVYVLEVNPNPDISPDSGAALQAKSAGMNYTDFIGKIISLALEDK
jgi:D-alanine-D-alanine ligase